MRGRDKTRLGLLTAAVTLALAACGGRSTIDFGEPMASAGAAGFGASGGEGGSEAGGSGGFGAGGSGGSAAGGSGGFAAGGSGGFAAGGSGGFAAGGSGGFAAGGSGGFAAGGSGGFAAGGSGGFAAGGSGGFAAGGSGGFAAGGSGGFAAGGSGGSGGSGPIACLQCVGQQCPSAQDCLTNQACRDGALCVAQKCLGGGGGGFDFGCAMGCFNGDWSAAMTAVQALQCVTSNCGSQCQGTLPGG
ncbi:MAG: hypothetical protein OZ921_06950 [Sorangiineae bacterium]|nr:hypothetical protein [Polyangiaceae bacterium]MEB2322233.1 hypothetical protein [Sorangiineae bacterium]